VPLSSPTRVFDSRGTPAPGLGVGPYAPGAVIDVAVLAGLPVSPDSVSAVAVNITSTGTPVTGFVQASPYLAAATGGTSTLNISTAGSDRPNFAIVPVGQGGRISLYLDAGGNAIVDVLGYFQTGAPSATDGRFVAIAPERWMDTRVTGLLPAGSVTPAPVATRRTATARRLPASAGTRHRPVCAGGQRHRRRRRRRRVPGQALPSGVTLPARIHSNGELHGVGTCVGEHRHRARSATATASVAVYHHR
jgi:hypothetical protein